MFENGVTIVMLFVTSAVSGAIPNEMNSTVIIIIGFICIFLVMFAIMKNYVGKKTKEYNDKDLLKENKKLGGNYVKRKIIK